VGARDPVVSFLDPDQRIASHGLGAAVPDFETMVATVRDLLADEPRRRALGQQAVTFMRARYDPERLIEAYLEVFRRFAPVRPAIGEPLLSASAR